MTASKQESLTFRTWGGKRSGAGRKPTPGTGHPPHRRVRHRPRLTRHMPVHVVLRVSREVGQLRRRRAYHAVRLAMQLAAEKAAVRIIHVSIQRTHIHLLVEADDKHSLARGMQGFEISAARRLNQAVAKDRKQSRPRRGQVFVHRYHATILNTPKMARHALAYVVNNWRRHREDGIGSPWRWAHVDPYSSGGGFDGWAERRGGVARPVEYEPLPVAEASTWLLRVAWRRHGLVQVDEVPGPSA